MDLDPSALLSSAAKLAERLGDEAYFGALCLRSGMFGLPLPHQIVQILLALERHGLVGGAISAGAVRFGRRPAIIDELGAVSYKQLDRAQQRDRELLARARARSPATGSRSWSAITAGSSTPCSPRPNAGRA